MSESSRGRAQRESSRCDKLEQEKERERKSRGSGKGTVQGPKYKRVEDVPLLQAVPPQMKVRDDELPLQSKKGILFMKD